MEDTTLYNIYSDKPFTGTIYNVYLRAFQSGLKLSSYYDKSTECVSFTQALLDDIFYLHQNITSPTNEGWQAVMFNVSYIIGRNYANTFLNCYLFGKSVKDYTQKRISRFVDINDVFLSFTFNLLSQSLQIRAYSTNLEIYQNSG